MSTPPPPPPDSENLQFDHAEYGAGTTGAAAASSSCTACQQPIAETYYEVGGRIFCPRCKEAIQRQLSGGSGTGRLLRAFVFGAVTALVGSLLYWGIQKVTGFHLGIVALVLGWMVGGAVRRGANMRGGAAYQVLAVLLTYASISYSFLPDMLLDSKERSAAKRELRTRRSNSQEAVVATAEKSPTKAVVPSASANTTSSADTQSEPAASELEMKLREKPTLVRLAAFIGAVLLLPLAFPVMMAQSSPISGLIYIFGLWQAWNMNKRPHVVITGPYQLREPAAGTAPPPLPQ